MLNMLPTYKYGQPVTFWATVSPTGSSVTLPNSQPYAVYQQVNLIYQPSEAPSEVVIMPGQTNNWSWNQANFEGKQVSTGNYNLKFFTVNLGVPEKSFKITKSWKKALKTASKWSARALGGLCAFSAFFEPATAAFSGLGAIGFKAMAEDPPDDNYTEIAEVDRVLQRLQSASLFTEEEDKKINEPIVQAIARLYDYEYAIKQTVERIDGASHAGADEYVIIQLKRLQSLCHEAGGSIQQFQHSIDKLKASGDAVIQPAELIQRLQELLDARSQLVFIDVDDSERDGMASALVQDLKESLPSEGYGVQQAVAEAALEVRRYGELLSSIASSSLDELREAV